MSYQIHAPHLTRPIQGVLFDMDGLVLDSEILFTRFWREAAGDFGFSMSLEQALGMRGLSGSAGEAQLHRYFGPGANYREIRARRIVLMEAYTAQHGIAPKPGIYELLDYLDAQGIPAAITSSSPLPRIRQYLEPLGLAHRFARLCSGHDVPHGKPAPDIYLYGAAQLGVRPQDCLALEDAPAGIRSAQAARCLPVLVPDLDQPGPELLPLLYAQADGLADVMDLLVENLLMGQQQGPA